MIYQKAGELSFNVVRIINNTDSAIRIKPLLDLPIGWAMFSTSFIDTTIHPDDSISLPFRLRIPDQASCDEKHLVTFRAYSEHNELLTEGGFFINAEPHHNWDIIIPENRIFFFPRVNLAQFSVQIKNIGNAREKISLSFSNDKRLTLIPLGAWDFVAKEE